MNNVIKGYKGIMDLELTNIDPTHHKSLIKQHKKDIINYKRYQENLPEELRYENTIEKIVKDREYFFEKRELELQQKKLEEDNKFRQIIEIHNAIFNNNSPL